MWAKRRISVAKSGEARTVLKKLIGLGCFEDRHRSRAPGKSWKAAMFASAVSGDGEEQLVKREVSMALDGVIQEWWWA